MTIREAMNVDEKLIPVLLQFGMHCLGCPHATAESLGEAAGAHGVDIDVMLAALNTAIEK